MYCESEDEDPDGVAFQTIFDKVVGPANPFDNEADLEDDTIFEKFNERVPVLEHGDNKPLQALEYLSRLGLPLSKLFDDVLSGDASICGERQILSARIEVLRSFIILALCLAFANHVDCVSRARLTKLPKLKLKHGLWIPQGRSYKRS